MEHQLTVRLPGPLSGKVQKKARDLGLRRSDVVRLALTEFLKTPTDDQIPYDRVRHLIGSIRTGIPDLGERHREYLLQKIRRHG